MVTTINAVIESAEVFIEDHGILTGSISLRFDSHHQSYGGYFLFQPKYPSNDKTGLWMYYLLKTFNVDKLSALNGLAVRVEYKNDSWRSPIKRIGHIIEDKWFDFEDLYNHNDK